VQRMIRRREWHGWMRPLERLHVIRPLQVLGTIVAKLTGYHARSAPGECITLDARHRGTRPIRHTGNFRPRAERLWQEPLGRFFESSKTPEEIECQP